MANPRFDEFVAFNHKPVMRIKRRNVALGVQYHAGKALLWRGLHQRLQDGAAYAMPTCRSDNRHAADMTGGWRPRIKAGRQQTPGTDRFTNRVNRDRVQ